MQTFIRRSATGVALALALAASLGAQGPAGEVVAPAAKPSNPNSIIALGLGFASVDHAPYGSPPLVSGQLRLAGGAKRLRGTLLLDLGLVTEPVQMPIEGGGTVECTDDPAGAACVHLMGSIFLGAEFHPAHRGPYAVAGIGFAYETVIVGNEDLTLDIPGANGFSYVLGGGVDLPLRGLIFTPFVHYLLTPKFDTKEEAHGGAEMSRLMIGMTVGSGSGKK